MGAGASALEGRRRLSGAFAIALSRIRPDPAQPRHTIDAEKQRELVASIRRLGVLQPVTVRYLEAEDVYQVIAGERRFQAAKEIGLPELPCWVQSPKNEEILLHQIVENWQRADLEPLEIAEALAVLREANKWNQKRLAGETGKPESEISRLLSLLKLQPEVQEHAKQTTPGVFTKRHLTAIAQLPPEDQQEVMVKVERHKLTARDTEHTVREKREVASGKKTRGAPPAHVRRFFTANAIVTLTLRKRDVTDADILAAIDEVRTQLTDGTRESTVS